MTPKADVESPEAVRAQLRSILAADARHVAHYREQYWPPETGRWTSGRVLEGMVASFRENLRDDPDGGWGEWLSVAEELLREGS